MDFTQLNETDVREEIVAPLVRELGYRSATDHNVLREQTLRYPRASIGRKNLSRDPLLRGKADYILEAGRKVRWVIEAKAPGCDLTVDEIEQAWTYANHPEVRAVYFALCNGPRFLVFRTTHGPTVPPILDVAYEQLGDTQVRHAIFDLLTPSAVLRDHAAAAIDLNAPLGPGLRSIARISHGHIRYNHISLSAPALLEMQVTIVGGSIERDEEERMVALLETRAPTRTMQQMLERLNLQVMELRSDDFALSIDPNTPTEFRFIGEATFPKGTVMTDPQSWATVSLPRDVRAQVQSISSGFLKLNEFSGSIVNQVLYDGSTPATFAGEFSVFLA